MRWYERAVAAPDGKASMKAAEQLANVRGRLGWEIVDKAMRHLDEMKKREQAGGQTSKARAGRPARACGRRAIAAAGGRTRRPPDRAVARVARRS